MGSRPFEMLVEAHHAEILRYLGRLTARSSEAEDLSQETFLRAYRAYRTLAPDANARAWLFAIATNLTRNHFRSERRRRVAHTVLRETRTDRDGDDPEAESELSEARTHLDLVVASLPLRQRMAFVLRKVHDFDYDVIAQSLACSAESARAHVFQALKKIRRDFRAHDLVTECER
jgi:RNA polymerase sigma-70 factor (ECF subfamily)